MNILFLCAALAQSPAVDETIEPIEVFQLFEIAVEKYPHLILDESLCKSSQKWANHLAKNKKFHHDKGVRENIAKGYNTCRACMNAWFKSSGHNVQFKRNKLVGFGGQTSGKTRYWVARFKNKLR